MLMCLSSPVTSESICYRAVSSGVTISQRHAEEWGRLSIFYLPRIILIADLPPLPKVLRCTICKGKVFFFSHSQNLPVLSLVWGRGLLQESLALAELWLQCPGCRNRRILGSKIVCFPCDGRIGYLKERDFHFWSWCSCRMMCKEGSVTGLVETAVVSSLQKAKQQDVHHSYTSAWNSISSASWGAAPARIKGSEPRGLQTGKSNSECISHYGKD